MVAIAIFTTLKNSTVRLYYLFQPGLVVLVDDLEALPVGAPELPEDQRFAVGAIVVDLALGFDVHELDGREFVEGLVVHRALDDFFKVRYSPLKVFQALLDVERFSVLPLRHYDCSL
jgi:hypothetical protein